MRGDSARTSEVGSGAQADAGTNEIQRLTGGQPVVERREDGVEDKQLRAAGETSTAV
jgi:hypothetical protein